MRVGIIGLGNIGSAIAHLITSNGNEVFGWEYNNLVVNEINTRHSNSRYLPDIQLSRKLVATTNLDEVFHRSNILFVAVPSPYIYQTMEPVKHLVSDDSIFINMAKGIDPDTGLTAFQTLTNLFPNNRRIMLAGPAIANEFARGMPTVVILAGHEMYDLLRIAKLLDSNNFRTRFSDDVIGVELGGILKNIYTIGLGIFDGKGIASVNFRSVYLTIALEEITRIGMALGGKAETFAYLAGMGDLLATSLSQYSHNRRMGELLAAEYSLEKIKHSMGVVPEGYNTLRTILSIAEKLHVSLPLAKGLWDVIHKRYSTEKFITSFAKDFVD